MNLARFTVGALYALCESMSRTTLGRNHRLHSSAPKCEKDPGRPGLAQHMDQASPNTMLPRSPAPAIQGTVVQSTNLAGTHACGASGIHPSIHSLVHLEGTAGTSPTYVAAHHALRPTLRRDRPSTGAHCPHDGCPAAGLLSAAHPSLSRVAVARRARKVGRFPARLASE